MNGPLEGLPGGVPIIGQKQVGPQTTAIVVKDENDREIALPLTAVALLTDSAAKDFSAILAPAVAAIVIKELERRGVIPGIVE